MAPFASITSSTGFQSLGVQRSDAGGIQPLPVAASLSSRGRSGRLRRVGGPDEGDEDAIPAGPPPPTREELEAAQAAQREAEQALEAAQREIAALRTRMKAQESASMAVGDALDDALAGVQSELREAYADVVLAGCRRLLGSLSDSEAVFHAQLDTVSEQLVLESEIVLRVAPSHKRAAEAAIFGRMGWSVEVDTEMDDGCVAVCRSSLVDARLETAFEGMEQALRAWLAQDGPGGLQAK